MTPDPDDVFSHPLVGRQRHLVRAMRIGLGLAAVLALVGVAAPGRAGTYASTAFMSALIAMPLLRVVWLTVRWIHRRDLRFAAVSAGVLLIAGLAGLSAW
jgi:uncharacterized membrane protein